MVKKKSNKKGSSIKAKPGQTNDDINNSNNNNNNNNNMIYVDPAVVRFQHSKIRPYFSGCGRSVTETLESIRKKEITPQEIPPIQVLHMHDSYFSLNNRRLWVLKRCREEGLLENNQILVRLRQPKSVAEQARYTVQNCGLEAKFIKESNYQGGHTDTHNKHKSQSNNDKGSGRSSGRQAREKGTAKGLGLPEVVKDGAMDQSHPRSYEAKSNNNCQIDNENVDDAYSDSNSGYDSSSSNGTESDDGYDAHQQTKNRFSALF